MSTLAFLSGNEAVAHAVRLCRPKVIAAYPITPQTLVVEALAQMVETGCLDAQFVHVESEHSALALVMGSAATGVRTFTATSSQGLLYMAECLYYSAGGRFPLVMMNANRALALPWNIYGDHSDALALISSGWIQAFAATAQEGLDMLVQAYAVAEDEGVRTPVLVNLDGFIVTHTYEAVMVPEQAAIDDFLPPPIFPEGYPGTFDLATPQSLAITAGPGDYAVFKYRQHSAMRHAAACIRATAERYQAAFGRGDTGLVETYRSADADYLIVTLGSIAGTVRVVVDELRAGGVAAGLIRLRYLRPFPTDELLAALFGPQRTTRVVALGVLEKDISFGHQGSVSLEVRAALYEYASGAGLGTALPAAVNYVAGLGGQDVSRAEIAEIFTELAQCQGRHRVGESGVYFVGLKDLIDDYC